MKIKENKKLKILCFQQQFPNGLTKYLANSWIKQKRKSISSQKLKIKLQQQSNILLLNVLYKTDLIVLKVLLKCTQKKIWVQLFLLKLKFKLQNLQCNLEKMLHFYKVICPKKKENLILMLLETEKEKFLLLLMLHQEDLTLTTSVWLFNLNLQEIHNLLFIELDVLEELVKKVFVSHCLIVKRTYKTFSEFKMKQNWNSIMFQNHILSNQIKFGQKNLTKFHMTLRILTLTTWKILKSNWWPMFFCQVMKM